MTIAWNERRGRLLGTNDGDDCLERTTGTIAWNERRGRLLGTNDGDDCLERTTGTIAWNERRGQLLDMDQYRILLQMFPAQLT